MHPVRNINMDTITMGRFPKHKARGIQKKLANPMDRTEQVARADNLELSRWRSLPNDSKPVAMPD